MMMLKRNCVCAGVLLVVAGCGGEARETLSDGTVSEALAPAGSDARFVSSTMKSTWYPGERGVVSVTMTNAGTNDWTASPIFGLTTLDGAWNWSYTPVSAVVHPSGTNTFSFIVGAPSAAGAQTFTADMQAIGRGGFGDVVSTPVTVSAASSRQWGCTYVPGSSSLPTMLSPGESRQVTLAVTNSGTGDWTSAFYLGSHDTPTNFWGQTNVVLGSTVASGATRSFTFSIRAPSTAGTYRFVREMTNPPPAGVGFFQASNFCVDQPIVVGGTSANGATVASQNFPATMAVGETTTVTVAMNDTGTAAWPADGSYALWSNNTPVNLWGTTSVPVKVSTSMGGTVSLSFNVTAPAAAGSYTQSWQMRKMTGADAGLFGQTISVPVVVNGSTTAGYGASVASQSTLPTTTPGTYYAVTVAMMNTGSKTWAGTTFGLRSVSVPSNIWGTTYVPLASTDSVASGDTHTFSFYVKAPSSGAVDTAWRMIQTDGVGLFGPTASNGGGVPVIALDCGDLLTRRPGTANGVYTIDMDGSGPTAPFDVYCDMTHGGWTQVNDQDVAVHGGYLAKNVWFAGVNTTAPNGGQWGILNRLSAFKRSTNDWNLRMTYGQDEARYAQWVQSGDPTTASRGTVSAVSMLPLNQVGCTSPFMGLGMDAGSGTLDGDPGGCWWFPIGSTTQFGSGLPAYNGSDSGQLVTDRMRLYVKR
ncbi:MAG TPA: NBR1-Ig-like domain-containing protein [Polyangiaceae bacterium]|jgi:hypothetical protein|nr:NBR1-Ig-like domain-containing protein [Polyangiaceae bacterium]